MKKHFVTYLIAGSFLQENITEEIENRHINELKFPFYTFGFELYTEIEENGKTQIINKQTYKIGKKLTFAEVELLFGKDTPAYRNMKRFVDGRCEAPFYAVTLNLQIVSRKDKVIDPHTLPQYSKEFLSNYDKRLAPLKEKIQEQEL